MESAISGLQALVSRPGPLFDAYASLAALEEVVFFAEKANDDRVEKFRVILKMSSFGSRILPAVDFDKARG